MQSLGKRARAQDSRKRVSVEAYRGGGGHKRRPCEGFVKRVSFEGTWLIARARQR